MKKCGTCQTIKPIQSFGKSKAKKDGLQSACKQCRSEYHKTWYLKNAELQKSRVYAHRQDIRQFLYDYLCSHPCVDCGETRVATLQFDHKNSTTKLFNIGSAARNIGSLPQIIEEINKCDVRCANCHAVRTAVQFGWYNSLTVRT